MANTTDKLERSIVGVRVGFVLLAVICYFGTLVVLGNFEQIEQGKAWDTLTWLIGTIAVAVGGDTLRPSGQKTSAFGGKAPVSPSP
jgi:hypothetical protein